MGSSSYANLNDEEYWLSGGNEKLRKTERTTDYWTSVDAAAAARAKQQGKRGSWGNVMDTAYNAGRPSGDGNANHGPEPNLRQQQLNRDLADPENQYLAKQLGLKSFDSANDMAQVWNRKFAPQSAGAPVDTAKAEQAVSSAQTWRAINPPQEEAPAEQPAQQAETSATSYASRGAQGERWTPSNSYAEALQGGPSGGDSVYDFIARRGQEGGRTFRQIGADYLQQARQSSDEIGLANQRAVDGLKGKLTDFINPWTDKMANGETVRNAMRKFMDG